MAQLKFIRVIGLYPVEYMLSWVDNPTDYIPSAHLPAWPNPLVTPIKTVILALEPIRLSRADFQRAGCVSCKLLVSSKFSCLIPNSEFGMYPREIHVYQRAIVDGREVTSIAYLITISVQDSNLLKISQLVHNVDICPSECYDQQPLSYPTVGVAIYIPYWHRFSNILAIVFVHDRSKPPSTNYKLIGFRPRNANGFTLDTCTQIGVKYKSYTQAVVQYTADGRWPSTQELERVRPQRSFSRPDVTTVGEAPSDELSCQERPLNSIWRDASRRVQCQFAASSVCGWLITWGWHN